MIFAAIISLAADDYAFFDYFRLPERHTDDFARAH